MDVADFSLAGRAMRNVRQMVKRIERAGYETRVRRVRDLGETELERDPPGRRRTGAAPTPSAASRWPWAGSATRPTATASSPPPTRQDDQPGPYGDLKAILHFVPWGTDGMSLDLMRRDRSADPGMNELLIVAALQAAPRLGIERVSLNFAMFRSALARGEKIGAGPVLRDLARTAGLPLPLVPDRVAVQVQREVPAALGAALRRLPHLRATCPASASPPCRPRASSTSPSRLPPLPAPPRACAHTPHAAR